MERAPPPHQMERFGRFSFTGELPVAAPRCASARVGGGVEEAAHGVVEEAGSRSSSPSPDARTPGPRAAGSWERTLMGCSWKMRSRRCEKNVDGMLTEDEAKKVDVLMMHECMLT